MRIAPLPSTVNAVDTWGLQVYNEIVSSASVSKTAGVTMPTNLGSGIVDVQKVAAAISGLRASLEEVRQVNANNAKIAAALTEAVKLAQDGAIDITDIFDVARRSIAAGSVKLSSLDELASVQLGDIDEGPAAPAQSDNVDVLTQYLRSRSGRR